MTGSHQSQEDIMAAIAFLLYAISGADSANLTALAAYPTHDACQAALANVQEAFQGGSNGVHLACISTDSLEELAKKNSSN
jgi:hypothetical protein